MKDIKSLYLTAKSSGKQADITAYIESIQDLVDNDPNSYITQLEYIISSDIGLKTLKPFIEKNGFPIACYDNMVDCLNECIRKCEVYKKDSSIYTEALTEFENFRKSHINCFMMFENYKSNISGSYVKTYYSKNDKGIQNRKLVAGMIKQFGEVAIPDALITAESINSDAIHKVLEFVDDVFFTNENCSTIYEWVLTACEDINYEEYTEDVINHMTENCLSSVVDRIRAREHQLYRESMIMNRDDLVMEYSEDDIKSIENLITFKEYQMTWADELFEERSHGKLKYDFRLAYDINTGHQVKIVYSLDNIKVTDIGPRHFDGIDWDSDDIPDDIEDAEKKYLKTLSKTISKSGDLDHQSKGQKILAIIDLVTNNKITETDIIGPFVLVTLSENIADELSKNNKEDINIANKIRNIDTRTNMSIPTTTLKYIKDYLNKNNDEKREYVSHIKVGMIDKNPSFKTTWWPKKAILKNRHGDKYNQTMDKINMGEYISTTGKPTRGTKIHDLKYASFDSDPYYSHPSKKELNNMNDFTKEFISKYKSDGQEWLDRTNKSGKKYKIVKKESIETIIDLQKEIYDLYEMFDGIIEENTDKLINEATWIVNTRNKKTGEIPGYLGKNHDLNYGEEDQKKKTTSDTTVDKEPALDDYRRPSASSDAKPDEPLHIPSAYDNDTEPVKNDEPSSSSHVSEEDKRIINNYYYTYTNSLNRNTHSVNNDNSIKGNRLITDDHSTKTAIDSYNKNSSKYTLIPEDDEQVEDKPEDSTNESYSKPWELNIFDNETFVEAVGDADDGKPKSDHPVKDILTDIDRATTKNQQKAKKKIQDIQNVGRAAVKPIKRTESFITNMINQWKDADENNIKEKMADPHTRNNLFSAIKKAIAAGSLLKAGILMNPIFLALTVTRGAGKNKREFRIRNEIIGELKTEMEIIDEKIKDAGYKGDNAEKYKLMRFKNELNKKLIRVGGNKAIKKMI